MSPIAVLASGVLSPYIITRRWLNDWNRWVSQWRQKQLRQIHTCLQHHGVAYMLTWVTWLASVHISETFLWAKHSSQGLKNGTPTKRQVSKGPVSKRLECQVYKTSRLQNVTFTNKTPGLQNVQLLKKHPYIFCTCGWWKSAGSVAAMFADTGTGRVLFSILEVFFAIYHHNG